MDIKNQPVKERIPDNGMALDKINYYLIALGVVVIIIGFILMSGGKYTDPNVFNGEALYSSQRITVAPIVVLLGFAIEIFAIFYKRKK